MTLDQAIARAKMLDFLAQCGWPETAEFPWGYEGDVVMRLATEALTTIDAQVAGVAPAEQAEAARAIKVQIDGTPPPAGRGNT